MPAIVQNETIQLSNLSNEEFLKLHARPGRIGLSGGLTLIDKAICRAERHLDAQERWGIWPPVLVTQPLARSTSAVSEASSRSGWAINMIS